MRVKDGKLLDAQGNLFDTAKARSAFGGQGNAIFVMGEYGSVYASTIHTPGKFHHSSFLAGKPVAAAGEVTVENGVLKGVTRRSDITNRRCNNWINSYGSLIKMASISTTFRSARGFKV